LYFYSQFPQGLTEHCPKITASALKDIHFISRWLSPFFTAILNGALYLSVKNIRL